MKWIIDIPESTITDLKKKRNRTEVDNAVINGKPLDECSTSASNTKHAEEKSKKTFITADEAIELLPEGENIHTFRQSGLALIGADWLREEIIDLIRKSDCLELTGGGARSMGHGLATYDHDAKMQSDILFVETDMEKLQALDPDEEAADGKRDNM